MTGMMRVVFLALLLSLVGVSLAKESYSGYSVLRAQVQDRDQAEALHELEQSGKYDFWTEVKLEVS